MQYGTVTGRFLAAVADTPDDDDRNPDEVPLSGKVIFTAELPKGRALQVVGQGATILPVAIMCDLDAQGYLSQNGTRGVNLIATDTDETNPRDFTYKVTFTGLTYAGTPVSYGPFSIAVPAGQTTDLSAVAPVSSSNGVPIIRGERGPEGAPGRDGADGKDGAAASASAIAAQVAPVQREDRMARQRSAAAAKLRRFSAQYVARSAATPVTIWGIGDSIEEGQGATSQATRWQNILAQLLGNADGVSSYLPAWYVATSIGQPATITGNPSRITNRGFGGRAYQFEAVGDAVSWVIPAGTTAVTVFYVKGSNAATASLSVDGTQVTTVDLYSGAAYDVDGFSYKITGLDPSTTHTVSMGLTAGSHGMVEGVLLERGQPVRMIDSGHWGWLSSHWAGGTMLDSLKKLAPLVAPDLVTIALGVNDINSGIAPSAFKTNLLTLITAIRSATATAPSILLTMYAPRAGTYAYPWQQYVDAALSIADSDSGVAVLNLGEFVASQSVDPSIYADAVHPNNTGHAQIGRAAADFLAVTRPPAPASSAVDEIYLFAQEFYGNVGAPSMVGGASAYAALRLPDGTANVGAVKWIRLPAGWSTFRAELDWCNVSTTDPGASKVVLVLGVSSMSPGALEVPTSSPSVTEVPPAAQWQLRRSVIATNVAATPDALTKLLPYRRAADAADTFTDAVGIYGIRLTRLS